jgi:5-methyltetrahydropteroyltriglutamate--homocysteine methyltransferase
MKERPLRTTVIGSYPFPGWLEFASSHLDQFGPDDLAEMVDDAVAVAVKDQLDAGLDVISDGEQTRLDFNLSFYGFLTGISAEPQPARRFGPPGHDQRGKHRVTGQLDAPRGLGSIDEYKRLRRIAPPGVALKVSVPGPFTLSGRLIPNEVYRDRYALTDALVPIVRRELEGLIQEGCAEICVDEPSMSCYAYREDPQRLVEIFRRTVDGLLGRCRLSTHLCFGNYKARAVAPRRYAPMFPAFLDLPVDEIHLEMASRGFAELDLIGCIAERMDVAVGIVDVKSYQIESPEEIAGRVRSCLRFASPERLCFAPDCGLSQTARWASRPKLKAMVDGVKLVRTEMGLE